MYNLPHALNSETDVDEGNSHAVILIVIVRSSISTVAMQRVGEPAAPAAARPDFQIVPQAGEDRASLKRLTKGSK
jgi:hypothetical protein